MNTRRAFLGRLAKGIAGIAALRALPKEATPPPIEWPENNQAPPLYGFKEDPDVGTSRLSFGDGDTGLYELVDEELGLKMTGRIVRP